MRPILLHPTGFREAIDVALRTVPGEMLDDQQWSGASYHPTPTIIEAARALYADIRSKLSRVTMRGHRTCASLHHALKNLSTRPERKSTNSFASSRVCPELVKHWSGLTLPRDAGT